MAATTEFAQAIRKQAAHLTSLVEQANAANEAHFARRDRERNAGVAQVAGATTPEWDASVTALWMLAGATERMVSLLVEADLA